MVVTAFWLSVALVYAWSKYGLAGYGVYAKRLFGATTYIALISLTLPVLMFLHHKSEKKQKITGLKGDYQRGLGCSIGRLPIKPLEVKRNLDQAIVLKDLPGKTLAAWLQALEGGETALREFILQEARTLLGETQKSLKKNQKSLAQIQAVQEKLKSIEDQDQKKALLEKIKILPRERGVPLKEKDLDVAAQTLEAEIADLPAREKALTATIEIQESRLARLKDANQAKYLPHRTLALDIIRTLRSNPRHPAATDEYGHGGINLYKHSVNVFDEAIRQSLFFQYEGLKGRYDRVVIHPGNSNYRFDPADPVIGLAALSHDLGKLVSYVLVPEEKEQKNGKDKTKNTPKENHKDKAVQKPLHASNEVGSHDNISAHILSQTESFWALPGPDNRRTTENTGDRNALLVSVGYHHRALYMPLNQNQGIDDDRVCAILQLLVSADRQAGFNEGREQNALIAEHGAGLQAALWSAFKKAITRPGALMAGHGQKPYGMLVDERIYLDATNIITYLLQMNEVTAHLPGSGNQRERLLTALLSALKERDLLYVCPDIESRLPIYRADFLKKENQEHLTSYNPAIVITMENNTEIQLKERPLILPLLVRLSVLQNQQIDNSKPQAHQAEPGPGGKFTDQGENEGAASAPGASENRGGVADTGAGAAVAPPVAAATPDLPQAGKKGNIAGDIAPEPDSGATNNLGLEDEDIPCAGSSQNAPLPKATATVQAKTQGAPAPEKPSRVQEESVPDARSEEIDPLEQMQREALREQEKEAQARQAKHDQFELQDMLARADKQEKRGRRVQAAKLRRDASGVSELDAELDEKEFSFAAECEIVVNLLEEAAKTQKNNVVRIPGDKNGPRPKNFPVWTIQSNYHVPKGVNIIFEQMLEAGVARLFKPGDAFDEKRLHPNTLLVKRLNRKGQVRIMVRLRS